MDSLEQSLDALTLGLQELESRKSTRGTTPISLPRAIDTLTLEMPPEISSLIEKRITYAEETRDVCVGMY